MEIRGDEVGDDLCVGCWGNPRRFGKVGGRFSVKIYRVNIELSKRTCLNKFATLVR